MANLVLYTGPMFSSKTTKLLMQADKRYYQKQKVIAFKSKMVPSAQCTLDMAINAVLVWAEYDLTDIPTK